MRSSNDIVEGQGPKKALIKVNAHLLTLLSVMWTAFSLIGVLFFREYPRPDSLWIALAIWALHLLFIGLSIFFWITETPKPRLIVDCGED
jgi:hypothetical protein